MAAANSDLFRKGGANTVTTLAAPGKALAATSITVGSTTNYPTDTGIVIGIRQVDSDGVLVPGTYSEYNATVTSGTTFSIDAVPVLGSDQVYPAGSTTQVFLPVSSSAHNDLIDGLVVSHDQDGTLKAGAVDNAAVLASNVVETPKIKDGAVTNPKLDITSSTDANGWKVTTLGTTKYYRKRVTFSQTISGLAALSISSSVLPVGVSSIGTRTLVYSTVISGSAGVILINFEGTSAHTFLSFTTATTEGSSRTVTGFIDVMLIED